MLAVLGLSIVRAVFLTPCEYRRRHKLPRIQVYCAVQGSHYHGFTLHEQRRGEVLHQFVADYDHPCSFRVTLGLPVQHIYKLLPTVMHFFSCPRASEDTVTGVM